MKTKMAIALLAVLSACGMGAQADVVIETVTVGNPGNTGELSGTGAGGAGPDCVCGAVDYLYHIARFEITAGQYAEFLNAVAATDTYDLWDMNMDFTYGCQIRRIGSPGYYRYLVDADYDGTEDADWVNRPVNWVSWGDAARFANWLHNGQPTGPQGLYTTEDGSYYLNGAMSNVELLAVTREPDATWVIPSEDEWYKAAYHQNDGVTGNYWDYSTSTDAVPSNDLINPDPGNNATFYDSGYTIGNPYYRTEVGAHENSESPYGTFDQGGNAVEWNEAILTVSDASYRGQRGGGYGSSVNTLHAAHRNGYWLPTEDIDGGIRVCRLPRSAGLGDLNCDGSINGLDIDPFVLALTATPPDYPEYYAQHPTCDHTLADCDGNGSINGLDIDPFVAILTGG